MCGGCSSPVRRMNPVAEKVPRAYVRCRQFPNPRFDEHVRMAQRNPLWRYRELAAHHHAAITLPDQIAEVLLELAS